MSNLYAGMEARDPMALDDAGDHYTKHVMAMTAEKLHSKADIAAELGYRDMRITELEAELEKYSEYTICDCCQSLTLEPVDAGGHMQCVSCTKLAELEQQLELSKAIENGFSTALFKAEAELAALREFARDAIRLGADTHYDVDGDSYFDMLVKHKLLAPHYVTEPCCDTEKAYCGCADYDNIPGECWRSTLEDSNNE